MEKNKTKQNKSWTTRRKYRLWKNLENGRSLQAWHRNKKPFKIDR